MMLLLEVLVRVGLTAAVIYSIKTTKIKDIKDLFK